MPNHACNEGLTRPLIVVASLILVVLLGIIDYMTGDYSLVIFYLLPISLASWFAGRPAGVAVAIACSAARFASDCFLYGAGVSSPLHYWNFTEEFIFFLIISLLVTTLRNALQQSA
jgi:hypothetical protein